MQTPWNVTERTPSLSYFRLAVVTNTVNHYFFIELSIERRYLLWAWGLPGHGKAPGRSDTAVQLPAGGRNRTAGPPAEAVVWKPNLRLHEQRTK